MNALIHLNAFDNSDAPPSKEIEPMGMLHPLSLRALLVSPRCRRGLVTLGIVLGCLPVAAAVAVVADQALEEHRRAHWGEGNPATPEPPAPAMLPPMAAKMAQVFRPDVGLPTGAEAPDFTLPDSAGKPVTLSSFRGKRPVVLVFGSFGCNLFCDSLGRLRQLREACQERAEFLFVYISEAPHASTPLPRAARPMPPAIGDDAHLRRVRWYEEETGGTLTWLLDGADERVEELYGAWPRRLVIVGVDGRVLFDAGHGLSKPWDMIEIEQYLCAHAPRGDLH
jgi:hypothetical protein